MARVSRRWLITGVSGGLGRALAEAALARGHSVAGTLREGAADFEALAPGRAHAMLLDRSRRRAVPADIEWAEARCGGIEEDFNTRREYRRGGRRVGGRRNKRWLADTDRKNNN